MGNPLHRRVIPETFAQSLFEYLEARGFEPTSLLGEPWPKRDGSDLGGIPAERWQHLLSIAAHALEDPLLGLHLGQTIGARHLGVYGSVIMACDNLDAMLSRTMRYMRLIFDVVSVSRRDGDGWFELVWDTSQYVPGALMAETGTVAMVQFGRDIVIGSTHPLRVDFIHESTNDPAPYEAFFGCPVRFGQPESLIRFSIQDLELSLKNPDPALIAVLEQYADRLLEQLPQQDEVLDQVRRAITRFLRDGEPSVPIVAEQLGCSSRTLQRRLAEMGTSFRDQLNLVRKEMALSYLRDSGLQIVDVAMLLGYSEHSAFSRAFKAWTGSSPQELRRSELAQVLSSSLTSAGTTIKRL